MPPLRSKAPLRIGFAGGGNDVSPPPEQKGEGAVLNCTIDKFAWATLPVETDGRGRTRVDSLDYNLTVDYNRTTDLIIDGQLDLVKVSLRIPHRSHGTTGAPRDLIRLSLRSDAPSGTGPGSFFDDVRSSRRRLPAVFARALEPPTRLRNLPHGSNAKR